MRLALTCLIALAILLPCKVQGRQKPFPYPAGLPDVPASLHYLNLCTAAAGAEDSEMAKVGNKLNWNGTEEQRFWRQVVITDSGCWQWTGNTVGPKAQPYGCFSTSQTPEIKRVTKRAHIWSYEKYVGPIPNGLELDHLCRNTLCIHPLHLEPVTGQINKLRGTSFSAINAKKLSCPQGHPYNSENTYISKKGKRHCKLCSYFSVKARRENQKLARGVVA